VVSGRLCDNLQMGKRCVAGLLLSMAGQPLLAIDLAPDDLIAPKLGVRYVQMGLTHAAREDYRLKGNTTVRGIGMRSAVGHLRYGRTFEWAGQAAVGYAQVAHGEIQPTGWPASVTSEQSTGDLSLFLGRWFLADQGSGRYAAVGAYLVVPTGSYEAEKTRGFNRNLGENRVRAALQVGYHQPLSSTWGWMAAADVLWSGRNDSIYNASGVRGTLDQAPLYSLQTAIGRSMTEHVRLGFSYFYTQGGETRFNGVDQNNAVRVHRGMLTLTTHGLGGRWMLQAGRDIKTDTGFVEKERLILRYTMRLPDRF
jgi:hypothetical protein